MRIRVSALRKLIREALRDEDAIADVVRQIATTGEVLTGSGYSADLDGDVALTIFPPSDTNPMYQIIETFWHAETGEQEEVYDDLSYEDAMNILNRYGSLSIR